ncbi:unnamed protein product [Gongylonema pulchrum]|uniref:UDP-N-acetylglucosamine transferase subunit ALG13 n=1 Tax=Gongylonema pulchrum TaxID=637853 RepID=A0A183E343_9BILA|nr:unnamed protein product [Gongylonema pulchrum]
MRCFVTVGSTEFDALVVALTAPECLQKLSDLGVRELLIQLGRGKLEPRRGEQCGIMVDFYRYRDNIWPDIASADLVIGHAGAGTCLEVLRARKPLIVVINEQLMGNHQRELADRLAELGHLLCTVPERLAEVIASPDLFNRKRFAEPDYKWLTAVIDEHMGIVY